MQLWKIKRMSVRRINLWLQAIGFLLRCYEKHKKVDYCPLCEIAKLKGNHGCPNCLWKIFEGMTCIHFQHENELWGDLCEVRNRKKWRTVRIPMLKNWKKILKLELARRNV